MFTTLLTSTLALGTALPAEQPLDPRTFEPSTLAIETPEDALRARLAAVVAAAARLRAIQRVNLELPGHESSVQLTGVYHNLLRQWAEL